MLLKCSGMMLATLKVTTYTIKDSVGIIGLDKTYYEEFFYNFFGSKY